MAKTIKRKNLREGLLLREKISVIADISAIILGILAIAFTIYFGFKQITSDKENQINGLISDIDSLKTEINKGHIELINLILKGGNSVDGWIYKEFITINLDKNIGNSNIRDVSLKEALIIFQGRIISANSFIKDTRQEYYSTGAIPDLSFFFDRLNETKIQGGLLYDLIEDYQLCIKKKRDFNKC